MASKKTYCDRVQRRVTGKTREEIMDAIYTEFDLPRPKPQPDQPDADSHAKAAKDSRKAKP